MTDLLRTACGLRVLPGENPRNWGPFSWVQEVEDLSGNLEDDVALMMIRAELMSDVASTADLEQWTMPLDLAFASLHSGDVPRVDSECELDTADPAVSASLYDTHGMPYLPFTVCGIIEGSWRSECREKLAPNATLAYLWTWQHYQERGEYFLLAGVHDGHIPNISQFRYADGGTSITAAEMTAQDVWGIRL